MICALHPSSSPLPLTTPIPNYDVWMKEIYLKKRTPNKIDPSYFFETIWDCASMYWTWSWTTYTICGKDMVWFLSLKVCLPQKCSGKRFHRRSRLCVCAMEVSKIKSDQKKNMRLCRLVLLIEYYGFVARRWSSNCTFYQIIFFLNEKWFHEFFNPTQSSNIHTTPASLSIVRHHQPIILHLTNFTFQFSRDL